MEDVSVERPGFASQPDQDENIGEDMDSSEFVGWHEGLDIEPEVTDQGEVVLWSEGLGSETENPESSEDSEYESADDEDEVARIVNTVVTLQGIGTFMSGDKDQKDEPRRRYDGVHSELLANTSSSNVVSMSERVIKFVHKQIVILALEEVDSQSDQKEESLLSLLSYGLAVVSRIAHLSEFSLRKDVTERRQGEKYRQLFREFFSDLLISGCCANDGTDHQVSYRLKLLSLMKDLSVNCYLRIAFLDSIVEFAVDCKQFLESLYSPEKGNFFICFGHLIEIGTDLAHNLKQEIFPVCPVRDESETTSRQLENEGLGNNNNLALTTAKPISRPKGYESLRYAEKSSFRLKLDQWMYALKAVRVELSFHDPDMEEKIRQMTEEVQAIVDSILGGYICRQNEILEEAFTDLI